MIKPIRALFVIGFALPVVAGSQTATDTIRLADLQAESVRRDPRARQLGLLAEQSALRVRNIAAEMLPAIAINGQSQYQSTVASIPVTLPGVSIPRPPRDMYDASVAVRQRIIDPAIRSRRNIERAQLAEAQARVRSTLFSLRQNVTDAYFLALRLQSQRREMEAVIVDLQAQHRVAAARVREGAALPSEARILEAELMRRRQSVTELTASRNAALQIIEDLAGRDVDTSAVLPIPDLSRSFNLALQAIDTIKARPEFELFARSREVLSRQASAASTRELPRLSAFGRAGYGRPGLNPLASEFDSYWLAGVQLEWSPHTWGSARRDRQGVALQQQIVESEENAFADMVARSLVRDTSSIARLERELSADDAIIALRESILREARARFREGVITSAEYVDRQTDVLAARVTAASHRIELAEARARVLTTLGLEVR